MSNSSESDQNTFTSALLPDGSELRADSYSGGYHGTTAEMSEHASDRGLPARGSNRSLLNHVRGGGDSAFRGATVIPFVGEDAGAVYWAKEDGIVYDIRKVPTWDVNNALEGRVKQADGTFAGNPASGEQELAIPSKVSAECIKRWAKVVAHRGNRLKLQEWIDNSNYTA